jgi:hypothetical protein
MCRYNYGIAVDYFAVGVIAYELMMDKVRDCPYARDHMKALPGLR